MPITPRGLIYPDSSAHTRTWEHWQALAESADAAIGASGPIVQRGSVSFPSIAAGANGDVLLTFPQAFPGPPEVLVISLFQWFVISLVAVPTATSVTIRARSIASSGSQAPNARWVAIYPQ